jgi:hypothetical protein
MCDSYSTRRCSPTFDAIEHCACCRYFQNAFLGAAGYSKGATLQVQNSTPEKVESVPASMHEAGDKPSAEDVSQMAAMSVAPSHKIVKESRVTFKESAHVLQRIVEFMYLGEIADLESGESTSSEDDYNLWMCLLTWYAFHCFCVGGKML